MFFSFHGSETPETNLHDRLGHLEDTFKTEIWSCQFTKLSNLEQGTNYVIGLLNQVKAAVSEIGCKVEVTEAVYEKVVDVTANTCITTTLRQ